MAKGFGPILLLGGVAAIFLLGKKRAPAGTVSGMRMIGDCEGIAVVDQGAAFSYLINKFTEIAEREGFNANTLEGLDLSALEMIISEMFDFIFPQCQWPPVNPDTFAVGAEGAPQSWTQMVDMIRGQLPAPGLPAGGAAPASGTNGASLIRMVTG